MVATLGVSAEPDAMRVFGTMGDAKYSQELWRAGANLYSRILRHPFLLGLVRGDLPTAKFGFFLEQDMAFLDLYSRSICLLAARAPGAEAVRQFSRDAADSLGAEQDAESGWLEQLGLQASGEVEPAPTTLAYGRFLLSEVQSGSFLQGVAAVLPCYWVYHEVGRARPPRVPDAGLPTLDRQLLFSGFRGGDGTGQGDPGPGGEHRFRSRTRVGAALLPGCSALRVDVLGHGVANGALACFGWAIGPSSAISDAQSAPQLESTAGQVGVPLDTGAVSAAHHQRLGGGCSQNHTKEGDGPELSPRPHQRGGEHVTDLNQRDDPGQGRSGLSLVGRDGEQSRRDGEVANAGQPKTQGGAAPLPALGHLSDRTRCHEKEPSDAAGDKADQVQPVSARR